MSLEDNVEILIKMADRFQVLWLLRDCEHFLAWSFHFTALQKLIVFTKFNLDELQKKCLLELRIKDVDTLISMDKESAMGVKLDGRLLQELLGKQKELMESKQKGAIKLQASKHEAEMSSLKAKACTRCSKFSSCRFVMNKLPCSFGL